MREREHFVVCFDLNLSESIKHEHCYQNLCCSVLNSRLLVDARNIWLRYVDVVFLPTISRVKMNSGRISDTQKYDFVDTFMLTGGTFPNRVEKLNLGT